MDKLIPEFCFDVNTETNKLATLPIAELQSSPAFNKIPKTKDNSSISKQKKRLKRLSKSFNDSVFKIPKPLTKKSNKSNNYLQLLCFFDQKFIFFVALDNIASNLSTKVVKRSLYSADEWIESNEFQNISEEVDQTKQHNVSNRKTLFFLH